ncbi:hypothetical protein N7448_002314 [Penicillium atrosanguineum]|uniref:NmrA-like domain-containing protein n=1 Tax=Penicillium atrosanguineum TaxID=1132637 RepID=A0A9W9HDI1_9EURO|nr:uncharacterized protein N7443_005718 [Penicillium atrosanguineum]KAJ5128597.1 hypothetical protein N7526_006763 [Penicillium atrosanguineum]KAJ5144922.1 hypothetical protein N7448_002314 [Penicillium atrosanguineum]KAJ5300716.1 hypothetical protein N7443_005718 [Penicillium atrosanguineum]KAJ5311357.1 hypothetical protein N7476_007217 [Penicillium atrosanguineum]
MVKIAFAGGSGNVAQEIMDVLFENKKHNILILSRKDALVQKATPGITWAKTNYSDTNKLAQALQGVHTLLSFVSEEDSSSPNQKTLIDVAVQAGVKRFAPSEWATSGLSHLGWYAYKGEIRKYLEELNKDKKHLEYTLFQPGFFVNHRTHPHQSMKYVQSTELPFDFENRRALMVNGSCDDEISLVTVDDFSNVVARAIDFEGEWPVIGGIRGTIISIRELIALGEKVRGGTPFHIEKVQAKDIESGKWQTSWAPKLSHPSIPPEYEEVFSRVGVASILLAISKNAYSVSDDWNRLLPDYKFTAAKDFLSQAWGGKPQTSTEIVDLKALV